MDSTALARELSDRIAVNLERARQLSEQSTVIAAQVEELRGTASSAQREITAVVDHRGYLVALTFSDAATDLGVDRLGATLMETVQGAIADVQRQADVIRAQFAVPPATILDQTDIFDKLDQLVTHVLEQNPFPEGAAE